MREQAIDGHGVRYERIRLFPDIVHGQEEPLPGSGERIHPLPLPDRAWLRG
ncbi:hypothetical protein [Streptomyces sp. PSAA01]|uniref:hypothetical protein n=1 Tax=Streptomyces sp. PSAA01 TaxID=2912762 RepID=UPI001F458A00|nr:hypothetical protein [Streptomyces sp. PSAA01]MCG0283956.1 hypothetical protein [Streptomyces sp. PSAA01]